MFNKKNFQFNEGMKLGDEDLQFVNGGTSNNNDNTERKPQERPIVWTNSCENDAE